MLIFLFARGRGVFTVLLWLGQLKRIIKGMDCLIMEVGIISFAFR